MTKDTTIFADSVLLTHAFSQGVPHGSKFGFESRLRPLGYTTS